LLFAIIFARNSKSVIQVKGSGDGGQGVKETITLKCVATCTPPICHIVYIT